MKIEDKIKVAAYKIAAELELNKDILIKKTKDGEIKIQALRINSVK